MSAKGKGRLLAGALGALLAIVLLTPALSGAAGGPAPIEAPRLRANASPDAPIGQPVHDQVDFKTGEEPTGTLTFKLYGPNDDACSGEPVSTSTVSVHGIGPYESASYRPQTVGTYRFVASYSGDAANAAVATPCGDADQAVVAQPQPPGTCHGQKATVTLAPQGITGGTAHHDVIVGNSKRNVIYAGDGNDLICAGGGNDMIDAGGGNDTVYGGAGNDEIKGYSGDDRLFGEAGNDFLVGQAGNDLLSGGSGRDGESGDSGTDTLLGGPGNDELRGGNETDRLFGGPGEDEEIQ